MANAYEMRMADRSERRRAGNFGKTLKNEALARKYEEAYLEYYGRTITVGYSEGWFTIRRNHYRAFVVQQMIDQLQAKQHEWEMNNEQQNQGSWGL